MRTSAPGPQSPLVSGKVRTEEQLVLAIRRPIRLVERQTIWLFVFLLVAGGAVAVFLQVASGAFADLGPDLWGKNLRGYTAFGELSGTVASVLLLFALGLPLRRRWFQEVRLPGRSTMMAWLSSHVALGLAAFIIATLHAGYGLLDAEVSTGNVLYWLLAIVTLTGVIWRLVYRFVPRNLYHLIGNYSMETSLGRAEHQATELEKLCAGGSEMLHQHKDWLLATEPSTTDLAQARSGLAPEEAARFDKMVDVATSRHRALRRHAGQKRAVKKLQRWRVLHVPLSLLIVLALPVHLAGVYGLVPSLLGPRLESFGTAAREVSAFTGVHPAEACERCHGDIYAEWRHSMHAHALTSPLMIVQNNLVAAGELKKAHYPDPRLLCVTCHGPADVALSPQATLPLPGGPLGNQGINCTVCHQVSDEPQPGAGAYLSSFRKRIEPGSTFFGPIEGAVGNTYHRSSARPLFRDDPSALCQSCHDVYLDRNQDGKIQTGEDLVLQTTYQEYLRYRTLPGATACVDCHMPLRPETRAAGTARIPIDQDFEAEPRTVRSHTFVGVDYPLSIPQKDDPQRPRRHALLAAAATLRIESASVQQGKLRLSVSVTNSGTGHDLPSGFAFMRQMWLELRVDADGKEILSSGVLAGPDQDLCDSATVTDPETGPLLEGCEAADPQLVNFQKKLVNRTEIERDTNGTPVRTDTGFVPVAAKGSHETAVQPLFGNPVVRRRPADGQVMSSIAPRQTRTFSYEVAVEDPERIGISARLLFRHLPPYALRSLARSAAADQPKLGPMIQNLDIVEMASAKKTLSP